MSYSIILAATKDGGIGKDGTLPWHIPEDMRFFRCVTSYTPTPDTVNCVIMGRKTFESMDSQPLKNRINIVLSRTPPIVQLNPPNLHWATSLDEALKIATSLPNLNNTFVIGGKQVYEEAVKRGDWDLMYLTYITTNFECDTFIRDSFDLQLFAAAQLFVGAGSLWSIPPIRQETVVSAHQLAPKVVGVRLTRQKVAEVSGTVWVKHPKLGNYGERGYLELVHRLYPKGLAYARPDRTQVGTHSDFGPQLTFDLRRGFPLLISKRVPFKMVCKELLFFISGSTDAAKLAAQNVHIWDDNTTREFLDNRGLTYPDGQKYEAGDMGPMYGFQWRHAGATYRGCKVDYTGQGVDQIAQIVQLLKEDPTSRRIILSAHNVPDLDQMALHPCHSMFQLYVSDGALSGKLTQRSADIFLGVPFNIASYALLIHMFARVAGLKVGKLIMSFGDAHLYHSHLEAAEKMLRPFLDTASSSTFHSDLSGGVRSEVQVPAIPYPELVITGDQKNMDDFKLEDFTIRNYVPGPTIRAKMAV